MIYYRDNQEVLSCDNLPEQTFTYFQNIKYKSKKVLKEEFT